MSGTWWNFYPAEKVNRDGTERDGEIQGAERPFGSRDGWISYTRPDLTGAATGDGGAGEGDGGAARAAAAHCGGGESGSSGARQSGAERGAGRRRAKATAGDVRACGRA